MQKLLYASTSLVFLMLMGEAVIASEQLLSQKETAYQLAQAETKGACVYTAGAKTYCTSLTQKQCTDLKGAWTSGGKCP
jgi:hypothetical protein